MRRGREELATGKMIRDWYIYPEDYILPG